jgi:hypothetical protein
MMYNPARDEFIPCEPELKHDVVAFGECSRVLEFFSHFYRYIADQSENADVGLKLMEREGVTFIRFEFEESWGHRQEGRAALLRLFPDVGCAIATDYENNGMRRLISHRGQGSSFSRGLVETGPRAQTDNDGDKDREGRDLFIGSRLVCDLMKNRNMEMAYGMLGYHLHDLQVIEPYYYTD